MTMNDSNKNLPMSESASSFIATASAVTLAVKRTESARLTRIILAVTLLIVTLLVALRYDYLSDAGATASDPAQAQNPYHNAYTNASQSATQSGILPALLAGPHVFATRNGHVEFTADMQGCLGVFAGDSRRLGGSIDPRTGAFDFHVYLKTLSTGIPDRDTELNSALNTDAHPFAEFTGTFHPAFDPASGAPQHVTAVGDFTLNGVTRHLEVPATLQAGISEIHLEAGWILDIAEFGIHPPAFLSVTVSTEQEIRLEATLEPQLLVTIDRMNSRDIN